MASASSAAPLQYIAPFVGCTLGEFFRNNGLSATVVYDDLSKHATAYRQLALLLRRPPGREAFPSDIFYLHARLLERAGRLASRFSGGSLTAFPVVETQAGDISAYIPTNIISITDGQLFLDYELFSKGHRPAIHTGLSVSRIGSSAQSKIMKQTVGPFKLLVAQLKQLERFESFAADLDQSIRNDILRGKVLTSLLKQFQHVVYPILNQVLLISFSVNLELEDLEGLNAADYGFFVKDLIRFIFSDFKYYVRNADDKANSNQNIAHFLKDIRNFMPTSKNKNVGKFFKNIKKGSIASNSTEELVLNGFLVNKVHSLNDTFIENVNNSEILYGVFSPNVSLIEYSFNYWTSTFFYPFFVKPNFLFNNFVDFMSINETNNEESDFNFANSFTLDKQASDLIGPITEVNDLTFYQEKGVLDFIVELLSFLSYELFLESRITTQLISQFFNDVTLN